jgi:hypothetical protein
VYSCGECSRPFHVEKATVYTDFERGHYLAVEPWGRRPVAPLRAVHQRVFDECFLLGPEIAEELAASMTHRIVFGRIGLREKLLAWDEGLDDRVLEALKLDALHRLGLDRAAWQLRLLAILPPGGHLLFGRYPVDEASADRGDQAVSSPRPMDHHTALRSAYTRRLARWSDLRATYPWLGDDWFVDGSLGAR